MRRRFALVLISAGVLVSGIAIADGPPCPEIFNFEQKGQDVEIIFGFTCSNFGKMTVTLDRLDIAKNTTETVIPGQVLVEPDAGVPFVGCDTIHCYYPSDICQTDPSKCEDCDNDSVPECCGGCLRRYSYQYLDTCVPPGNMKYTISDLEYSGLCHYSYLFTVDHVLDCQSQDAGADAAADAEAGDAGDADVDADGDTDTDADGDADGDSDNDNDSGQEHEDKGSNGCSVGHVPAVPGSGVLVGMLMIGLVTLLLSRKRRI